jgi:hypothetical protein
MSDDKQVLSIKVLRIFIRPGWGMHLLTRRYKIATITFLALLRTKTGFFHHRDSNLRFEMGMTRFESRHQIEIGKIFMSSKSYRSCILRGNLHVSVTAHRASRPCSVMTHLSPMSIIRPSPPFRCKLAAIDRICMDIQCRPGNKSTTTFTSQTTKRCPVTKPNSSPHFRHFLGAID